MPRYIDVHSHLQFPQYGEDRADVLARMKDAGVWTLTVGTNLETSKEALDFVSDKDGFFATAGLHPNDTGAEQFIARDYEQVVSSEKVVAIGECGLDYYRITNQELGVREVKKRQEEVFVQQIEFALKHDKPLMLHCRPSKGSMDAYEHVLSMLRAYSDAPGSKLRGNVHFFVGNTAIAKGFLELGFTMSFTGVVTFAREYDEVLCYLPIDSVLSETDAPFAAPEPYRGRRNEPSYVVAVVEQLAAVRGERVESVRVALVENARRMFSIG